MENPKFKELVTVLIDWINDELAAQRIIVKFIDEDLYDGQILQKLLGELLANQLFSYLDSNLIFILSIILKIFIRKTDARETGCA